MKTNSQNQYGGSGGPTAVVVFQRLIQKWDNLKPHNFRIFSGEMSHYFAGSTNFQPELAALAVGVW